MDVDIKNLDQKWDGKIGKNVWGEENKNVKIEEKGKN